MGSNPPDLKRTPRQKQAPRTADRLPPHSPESEMGILGCIFLAPNDVIPRCIEAFPEGGSVFYDLKHLVIYNTCVELWDERSAIDVITVHERLKREDQAETIGGLPFLASLPDKVPSAANASYYIDIVKEKYLLRTAIQTGMDVVQKAYEPDGSFEDVAASVESALITLTQRKSVTGLKPMREAVTEATARFESYMQNRGALTGIATGFADLDRMTSGLQNSDMIVIAARPSMGKTSLALNIADNVAVTNRLPVGIFSLEMSTAQLVERMICSRARVNMRNVREGFLAERDFPRLTSAMGQLANAPIWIDDTPGLSLLQLRTKMRRMQQQYGIRLFVIDYMQLLHANRQRGDSRQQEISEISRGVKGMAKELNVPVIILSQLNREIEKDKKRRPRLSDLRESGAIEQDADLIGFLFKPRNGDDDAADDASDAIPVTLAIEKQRNGPTGDVDLTFFKSFTRFESAARVSNDDYEPESRQREFETQPDP